MTCQLLQHQSIEARKNCCWHLPCWIHKGNSWQCLYSPI